MKKSDRNKPCPCGSGKKYKYCCLKKDRYLKNLPDDALKRLKEEFSKYNQEDLIKTLAALSICPENQSQQIRLEIATQIACSNNNCEDRIITIQELNELFLKYLPTKGPIGLLESPLDNVFTNNILFFKNYVIYSGSSPYEYYILQKMLNTIHFNSSSFSEEYLNYFYQISRFILSLSDYIAKKTGHKRYEVFENRLMQEIFIPDIDELNSLKKSVTFNNKELKDFKKILRINEDIGDEFIVEVGDDNFNSVFLVEKELKEHDIFVELLTGTNPFSKYSEKNPLLLSSLIKIKDNYIIYPTSLPITLRHNILSSILKSNEKKTFIKNYQDTLWREILLNLENKLHFKKFDYELPEWKTTIFRDEVFKIDNDKLAYCILINDNLKNYINNPFEISLKYKTKLKNRINLVTSNLLNTDEIINDILIVLFVGMSGRSVYEEKLIQSNLLIINCEEFNIMINSGNYDSLTLFKFANLLENTDINRSSFLEEFGFYIENDYSFYVKDNFDLLVLFPEYAKQLRIKAIKNKDPHLERYGDNLLSVYKISEFMYVTDYNIFLIKLNNQNIWIKFENNNESVIAEAICYWIWHFGDELYTDLRFLNKPITILVNLEENDNLDSNILLTNEIKETLIISSNTSENEIKFKISKNLIPLTKQGNNEADRLLMNEILKLMGNLLEKNSLENTLTEERRLEIINEKVPLGLKKQLLIYTPENINTPVKSQIRLLQKHNIQLTRDGLVNKVSGEFDYNQKLTKDQSHKLSHQIVDYYLDCIKKEIIEYDWEDLIQKLILNYENILFSRYFTSFNNVYYFNNYDNNPDILKDIVYDEHELDKMGLPTRFLIEILSAEQNFSSNVKISNESFDNLMGLSYNLIEWGFASDYIYSEYVDYEIIPLESGRFETETNINDIIDTFRTNRTLEHITNLSRNIFLEKKNVKKPSNETENAFKSEFGINLTDYYNFISVLINIAVDDEKDIVFISKSNLIDILKDKLGWESDKSVQTIEKFSLKYRNKWEKAPEGFDGNDIYPWVFRRPLSYYLRPLIIKNDDDETVIYGFRNVYHSCLNLNHQIFKGLYKINKNSSDEFKSFISKMLDVKGKEFNKTVFKWFKNNLDTSEFYFEPNVQIDKIVNEEPKYGDIDVLLMDKNKKRLFSIECKNIESAKNPRQIFQEIEKFFNKKEWIKKHERRDEWIKDNLDKLGESIGHDLKDYKVFSIFIVSQELPIIYLKDTPIDIIPFSHIINNGMNILNKYK